MATAIPNTKQEDENFETYYLIWLDASVNNSKENIKAQKELRTSINHLITFDEEEQCFHYIESIPKDDRIILIVSGKLGQIIVPKIIHFRQITSIYVYCMNKKANEEWSQNYIKVKGVFTQLNELINQIKSDQIQRQQYKIDESLSINIYNTEGQSTSELNGKFIHSQLLIDCLIRMKSTLDEKNDLILFCKQQYKNNKFELNILEEFKKYYLCEESIWWYTRQSFLYRLLNKALRTQNIDLLYQFRFFIRHIGQQLQKNKSKSSIRVYRAQMMSIEEIKILKNSIGDIISINSFLSTSLNQQRAKAFFSKVDLSDDLKQVFFEIDADPKLENIKSFSNITKLSFFPDEEEILFMVGSIFKIKNIFIDNNGIYIIQMNLSSYNNHHLQTLFQHMKQQLGNGQTNLINFGDILMNMGKLDHAEKYLLRFLNQLSNDHQDIGDCYHSLGRVENNKGDYESSLKWYNKSLEIKLRTLKPDDPSIAYHYNNMATVYGKKGDYDRALESFNKALIIFKQAFGKNHSDVAACLNNMGNIYYNQKKYSQASQFYQKSLTIREKCLPENHPHLAGSHGSIGALHYILGDRDMALKHYQISLKIYTNSLPTEHPDIAFSLKNIGNVHEHRKEFEQALSYYEKAARIYRHSFASTHPDVIQIEKDVQRVSLKLK